MAMRSMKIAALKDSLSATLRRVEAGEEVLVTDRDRPIAILRPVEAEEGLTITPAKYAFSTVRDKKVPPTKRPVDSLGALLAERGNR